MSLYDGVGIGEVDGNDSKADLSGWKKNSGIQMLQNQLQTKKAGRESRRSLKTSATLAPVVDLKRGGEIRFNPLTGKAELVPMAPAPAPPPVIIDVGLSSDFLGLTDEYNPLRPNEYDECARRAREQRQKEREERRAKEDEERHKRRERREARRESRRRSSDEDSGDEEEEKRRRMSQMNKAAIAPPTALIEQDKVQDTPQPAPALSMNKPKFGNVSTVAANIMAKMGYRQGQGLGAKEQGMSRALEVEKTSRRGGRILHEKDIAKIPDPMLAMDSDSPNAASAANTAELLKNPTKIVLLRNMVGPGEVDEELEPETAEECSKYGKVIKCLIFEIPNAEPENAVRIFLEFDKVDAAIKAVIDLNGRFFGGRSVLANFYDFDRFHQLDLTADPM